MSNWITGSVSMDVAPVHPLEARHVADGNAGAVLGKRQVDMGEARLAADS